MSREVSLFSEVMAGRGAELEEGGPCMDEIQRTIPNGQMLCPPPIKTHGHTQLKTLPLLAGGN